MSIKWILVRTPVCFSSRADNCFFFFLLFFGEVGNRESRSLNHYPVGVDTWNVFKLAVPVRAKKTWCGGSRSRRHFAYDDGEIRRDRSAAARVPATRTDGHDNIIAPAAATIAQSSSFSSWRGVVSMRPVSVTLGAPYRSVGRPYPRRRAPVPNVRRPTILITIIISL